MENTNEKRKQVNQEKTKQNNKHLKNNKQAGKVLITIFLDFTIILIIIAIICTIVLVVGMFLYSNDVIKLEETTERVSSQYKLIPFDECPDITSGYEFSGNVGECYKFIIDYMGEDTLKKPSYHDQPIMINALNNGIPYYTENVIYTKYTLKYKGKVIKEFALFESSRKCEVYIPLEEFENYIKIPIKFEPPEYVKQSLIKS